MPARTLIWMTGKQAEDTVLEVDLTFHGPQSRQPLGYTTTGWWHRLSPPPWGLWQKATPLKPGGGGYSCKRGVQARGGEGERER